MEVRQFNSNQCLGIRSSSGPIRAGGSNGNKLPSTEKTLNFTIVAGTSGNFSLLEVASGLNFPAAMATAPDGRIFVTELITGNIRVVTPTATPPWKLQTAPFYTFTSTKDDFVTGVEKGLLGIAVDPEFQR